MHLIGVKEENGWDLSRWELTYRVSWGMIKKAIALAYEYYDHVEIFVDNRPVNVSSKEDILRIEESRDMVIRGMSKIINAPVMIVLYNQLTAVDVNVAQLNDEFKDTDYEKFNHSMCQFLDSLEIAMYR
ncbi:MAG: hypothetical protein J5802_02405 [Butyrivibrio sp.]|nr:hypothetical protein [Butyrivibrio sp.]